MWRRRLPTGIDRVCLAYLQAFAGDSLAMLQWGKRRVVLGPRGSDALFRVLLDGANRLRRTRLAAVLARTVPAAMILRPDFFGRIYFNLGHTGLNAPGLAGWIAKHGLKAVYLIHDLIPLTHPEYCRPNEPEKHARRMRNALDSAHAVIVNSRATGTELERFARQEGLAMPEMLVAHLGIEKLSAGMAGASPWPSPYFLCIGTIEARKNHILLLRAWAKLRAELGPDTPDLVLVGQRGWEAEETFALLDHGQHEHGKVVELDGCRDAELAALIDHARAVLMPSHVEGYGLPVLEAMSRGAPVIASDLAVYREITDGIPLFLDPNDEAAWVRAITVYLANSPEREGQRSRLAAYRPPEWSDHMAQVRTWLRALGWLD